ncbi:hypothetical protein KM1_104850 [Entamoeba histolytica HM-3:IMSS]|uniref:Uncharacterized protein n=5 Tax=Entamoeba histolytica TaxID=5759 RepID=C4LV19_ENTH1|nr:hypothetical protein EHI_092580 [Entamoeba histolytica HM-1:IMSS]EMD48283.1 Hypothetical protein EHI5A_238140 [Entamoeba histolytica KU27]EMS11537.1 hypothetical protein KM1_104850 [Entamoeba histolytica HM-3:IMSS]ENY65200.1 hypothetical protein EHI7A_189400 [Entamoeba histolytica HM-1:IMSS-A]GAT92492.1 hypothetical protein CL6EHI_092580 [Entamoeba histolytica]EAL45299.2 hypothetical protein EHI_092580 [Entamoeba histolytica HM-1:IMSS]|eukprot:XP_650686.2 hypothetical protein EHI_092580 [Entamoeba histolytica HM-1:IMSS]
MISSAFITRVPFHIEDGNVFVMNYEEKKVKNEMINAKRESKNRDAAQQAFIVGVLSQSGYEVNINRLYKRGNMTYQMFTINNVKKDDKVVFDASHLEFEYDGLKEKRQYLDAITNNYLIELLNKCGVIVEERKTRKVIKPNSIAMKRLNSVTINGKFFGFRHINEIGCHFNQIIRSRTSTKSGSVVLPYDVSFECPNLSSIRSESC